MRVSSSSCRFLWRTFAISALPAMLTAMVWISSTGRLARITGMLVSGWNAKPVNAPPTTTPASIPGSDRSHRRGTPVLILSTVARVRSSTLGSRLNCISGTSSPARAESTSRLRISAGSGAALRRASWNARCGQSRPMKMVAAHAAGGADVSCRTASTGSMPRPMPRMRKR